MLFDEMTSIFLFTLIISILGYGSSLLTLFFSKQIIEGIFIVATFPIAGLFGMSYSVYRVLNRRYFFGFGIVWLVFILAVLCPYQLVFSLDANDLLYFFLTLQGSLCTFGLGSYIGYIGYDIYAIRNNIPIDFADDEERLLAS